MFRTVFIKFMFSLLILFFTKTSFATISSAIFVSISSASVASTVGIEDGSKHYLPKASVMDRVILAVMDQYYDSARADSKKMFKGAMNAMVQFVAEVKVNYSNDDKKAIIEVAGKAMAINFEKVNSPWSLSKTMKKVFSFLYTNLSKEDRNYRKLEYVAVNGLLSVLDPHTSAMMPDIWGELRMSTQGEFEGIGVKITTDRRPPCKGTLTVVEVFKDSPAQDSGMKKGDKIIKIEGESSVNITTDEAAKRLRGKHGTHVNVRIKRPDGSEKNIKITRNRIPIESVKWKMLDGKVGYIELSGFQRNSLTEMKNALKVLRLKEMKGLVFDLRNNPGGLLGVAIQIADLFLDNGTIVTTAGKSDHDRDVSNATVAGTEPNYPIVILINGYSASAAELIAGAIRNHGRALLIGDRTFGKGSVQTIMSLPDGGGLRLTIQQYLTPGDISIQAVGVTPDIKIIPVVINKEELNFNPIEKRFSEASLDAHLTKPGERKRGDRIGSLRMQVYVPKSVQKADKDMYKKCYTGDKNERVPFKSKYELEFARRLIEYTKGKATSELLADAKKIIGEDAKKQQKKINNAFKKIGINWSTKAINKKIDNKNQNVDAAISATASIKEAVFPGKKFKIAVTVKNESKKNITQLRGVSHSDNLFLEGYELAFGKIDSGKSKTWNLVVDLPPIATPRTDPVTIEFFSAEGDVPEKASVNLIISPKHDAVLDYEWYVEDISNGNGFYEPGEELELSFRVKNVGKGSTYAASLNLSAKPGIDIINGHFDVGTIDSGKTVSGKFRIRVVSNFNLKKASLRMTVNEWVPMKFPYSRNIMSQEIFLPIFSKKPVLQDASGTVTVIKNTMTGKTKIDLYSAADNQSRVIAYANAGTSFKVVGKIKKFFKIQIAQNRHAWLAESFTKPGGIAKSVFTAVVSQLPKINLSGPPVVKTSREIISIKGTATHAESLLDVIVFVGDSKIAYLPSKNKTGKIDFKLDVPLEEGANNIIIIARHNEQIASTETVFVRMVKK